MPAMKMKSALSNGLLYGGIFGGVICLFVILCAVFGDGPLEELALAGGVTVLGWGGLGFAAGFFSYHESRTDPSGHPIPGGRLAGIKHWLYRIVAGILLSYLVMLVASAIGLAVYYLLWDGDLPAIGRNSPEEMRLFFIGCCGMLGATVGTIAGCWLGALLMPGDDQLGNVAKGAFVAAILGLLGGGWLGALVGLVAPQYLAEFQTIIVAAITGSFGGIIAAIIMRMRIFPDELPAGFF